MAVAARLAVILRHGGLDGNFGYDAGVYFAGSDSFVHGRLPYRDFVLIHPPALMLLLSPFALLTHVVTDETVFTTTVVAFTVLGGVNAVLVMRVVRGLGLGLRAATAAGLFYALWFGAIGSEYLIKPEPAGNLFLLLALLATLRARRDGPLHWPLLTGVALGTMMSVKIWWVVPAAGVLLWFARRTRSGRQVAAAAGGVVLAGLLVDGPFFVDSPHAMWSSVIEDQTSRGAISRSPWTRLSDLSSVPRLTGALSHSTAELVSVGLLVALAWLVRRAWDVPAARPVAALLVAQLVVLLLAPSWFPYYADYIAVAAAVTVGAAAHPHRTAPGPQTAARETRRLLRPVAAGWLFTLAVAAVSIPALVDGRDAVPPFTGAAALTRATAHVRCVMSDSPMGQIEIDALSRSLADGCRNWVDVTGRTYGPDRASVPRVANRRWQRDLTAYLRSGGAVLIVRQHGTGIAPQTRRAIARDGTLARAGGHRVYLVRHRSTGPARRHPTHHPQAGARRQ
ncbi:hypothetical protein [uncultured Jatrophihabitans sp.]|uniref:hypothetical protein n=1 Tax=uncultured Jatrophihabitans sp. TaxID=1610747 RepID=UPI0035CA1283